MKTLEELQDSGCQPVDLNQDPVALNSELSRKDRELTAKVWTFSFSLFVCYAEQLKHRLYSPSKVMVTSPYL